MKLPFQIAWLSSDCCSSRTIMLSKQTCQLICLCIHNFFFFDTWRIAIRKFQVVCYQEIITFRSIRCFTHTEALNSQRYDYLIPALLHAISLYPFIFTVLTIQYLEWSVFWQALVISHFSMYSQLFLFHPPLSFSTKHGLEYIYNNCLTFQVFPSLNKIWQCLK